MDAFSFICLIALLCCGIMFWRNNLIYKYRMRALKETRAKAKAAIHNGDDWEACHKKYDEYGTYDSMFYDLKRWKYREFYPDI